MSARTDIKEKEAVEARRAPMQFIDLQAQRERLGSGLDQAIQRVLTHGAFIGGPEVTALEKQLSGFCEAAHTITCANGTDALQIALMAWNIGPGDAVFIPDFTFTATAEVVALVGATPVMVDVRSDTFNLDVNCLTQAIDDIKSKDGLTPRAIIAVDLFGLPADYPALAKIAHAHGLKLISDSAQGFGATLEGRHPVSWADVATTSFYPAKPLGCYGDGGAIFTNDKALADIYRSLRNHGQGADRFDNARIGLNSRLDTIQAAILLEKLNIFAEEIDSRNEIADRYSAGLGNIVETPMIPDGARSIWAQYTIKTDRRDGLADALRGQGIPVAIHYNRAIHQQTAYRDYPSSPAGNPVSEALASQVLSLPMHPYLTQTDQEAIISAVRDFFLK